MAKFKWKSQDEINQEEIEREQRYLEHRKHQEELDRAPDEIKTLGQSLTDREIENIEQGQLITDLNIRILEMEAKSDV